MGGSLTLGMRGKCAEDIERSRLATTEIFSQEMMKNESQGRLAQGCLGHPGKVPLRKLSFQSHF